MICIGVYRGLRTTLDSGARYGKDRALLDPWLSDMEKFAPRSFFAIGTSLSLLGACSGSNDFTIAPNHAKAAEATVDVPGPLDTGRLPALARPTRYALNLTIDPKEPRFSGRAVIGAEVSQPTQAIVLHGRELTFTEVAVVDHGEVLRATATARASAHALGTPDEIVLTLPRKVEGTIEIDLGYTGAFSDQLVGAYRVASGGDDYVFTQFEPMDARRAFPCFDEPGFKVPFDLTITTPVGNVAVANTLATGQTTSDDKKSITFRFAPTKPLPSYLVAFAVGPLEIREAKGSKLPLRVITTRGKAALGDAALEAGRAHMELLEKYFDHPYPYDKLDLVAVPDFAAGAMENAGFITFREELILIDPKHSSVSAQRSLALTVAHELSHHWFGDLVTMSWWDDLWLNEGFATWMESKIVDSWRPELGAGASALAWRTGAMQLDARLSAKAVRRTVASASDAEEAFDGIVYDKGAAILGMLESWLGPDKFQAGVRQYLHAHAYGSATSTDLFQALGDASGKDVLSVATSFLDQPGVPLVSAKLECKKDASPTVLLAQKRLLLGSHDPKNGTESRWKIPVCIGYDGDKSTPACTLLDGETARVELPKGVKCPSWISPNAGQRGYYRYSISPAEFRSLARSAPKLDVVTRFGMLDDAYALVESGELGVDVLLDLLAASKPTTGRKGVVGERVVTEEVVSLLVRLEGTVVDAPSRAAYSTFVGSLLLPLAQELGFDPKKGESEDRKLLRRSVLEGLVNLVDDPWVAVEAERRTKAFLADPASVDIDAATIALKASSRHANAARFDQLFAALGKAESPQIRVALLGGLGSFEDSELLERALGLMFRPEMKKQDGLYIVRAAVARPASRPKLLGFLGAHTSELKKKVPAFLRVSFVEVLRVCDADSIGVAHTAFDGKLSEVDGGDRAVSQLFERANLCTDLAARERARLHAWLKVK